MFEELSFESKTKYNILVVDDDAVSRLIAVGILENAGFSCQQAALAKELVPCIEAQHPDLILLDIQLPDGDGFALCAQLQTRQDTRDIPVIFITGQIDDDSKIKGLSIGGVDYITKPFNGQELVARVRIHIRLKVANQLIIEQQKIKLRQLTQAHQSFLTNPKNLPDSHCAVYFEEAAEAGGDQYDLVQLGNGIYGYLVADVSGHGIEASYLSSVVKVLFRENASIMQSPVETFQRINAVIKDFLKDGQLLTATYLQVNRRINQAYLVSAGHLPALLAHDGKNFEPVYSEGDILGAFDDPFFAVRQLDLKKTSRICLYSDGVVEDFEKGSSWKKGIELLQEILSATYTMSIDDAITYVGSRLFVNHPGADDRLLLLIEI